jgi:transglycosylase-like protein with SLT domain
MHRSLCLITLALTTSTLAFADMPIMKDELQPTQAQSAEPDLSKDNSGDAKPADAQHVPDVSLDLLCDTLAASAHRSGLPASFFANLIWQESRFVFRAVSPAGALGIAQFMPKTAASMGLTDPFDPLMALPASARLLGSLFQRFGNLGLAAAAYNAGEARVSNWLSNRSGLPQETRNYVLAITGLPVEHWKDVKGQQSFKLAKRMPCRGHEAFAEADAGLDEASPTEVPATKASVSAERAPRMPPSSVGGGRVQKVVAKLRKSVRAGWRGRNSGERHALHEQRVKMADAD